MSLELLGIGLALGLVSSVPIGPINCNVARWIHDGKTSELRWFVAGVIVADILVAALALLGLLMIHLTNDVLRILGLVGGAAFLLYGCMGFLKPSRVSLSQDLGGQFPQFSFLTGLMFCGLNPAFYLFWAYSSSLVLVSAQIDWLSSLTFLVGISFGDLLWFFLFAKLVHRFRHKFTAQVWAGASHGLITIFGVYAIWRALNGTAWSI